MSTCLETRLFNLVCLIIHGPDKVQLQEHGRAVSEAEAREFVAKHNKGRNRGKVYFARQCDSAGKPIGTVALEPSHKPGRVIERSGK